MKFHTDLTRQDIFLARTFLFFRPGFNLWVAVAVAIVIPGLNSNELLTAGGLGTAVFILLCLLTFAFYSVVALTFSAFELWVTTAPKRGLLGKHDLSLTPEGLVEQTSFNRTVHPWPSVDCLLHRPGMTLVRAGAGWHLIPQRAIAANEEGAVFVRELEAKIIGMRHET